MRLKAFALYDFVGNPDCDEITFKAGDTIFVTNTYSDDGWWEGLTKTGNSGFFPELYVELLPPEEDELPAASPNDRVPTPPGVLPFTLPKPPRSLPPPITQSSSSDVAGIAIKLKAAVSLEKFDSEDIPPLDQSSSKPTTPIEIHRSNSFRSGGESEYSHRQQATASLAHPIKKSVNRFSNFVTSGTEEFLLNARMTDDLPEFESKLHIVNGRDGPKWQTLSEDDKYDISISGYETKSKFGGAKQYTAYMVQDRKTSSIVLRRYKHFEWLNAILIDKFTSVCIPPLPEKQAQGRFDEEFVELRRRGLERYLRRLCRHPLVRESTVFHFFLTCADEKAWKIGKRASERDPVKGAKFLETIDVLNSDIPDDGGFEEATAFTKFIKNMKFNSQALIDASNGFLFVGPTFQNIYGRLSFSVKRLVHGSPKDKANPDQKHVVWCWKENCETCAGLTERIDTVSQVLKDVSTYWDVNSQKTSVPMIEQLKEYDGLIDSMDTVVDLHEKTSQRLRDLKRQVVTKHVDPEVADLVMDRCYTVLNVSFAEMNRFHDERATDFDKIMGTFIRNQIEFHERMLEKYRKVAKEF